jgi:hypothetical protein
VLSIVRASSEGVSCVQDTSCDLRPAMGKGWGMALPGKCVVTGASGLVGSERVTTVESEDDGAGLTTGPEMHKSEDRLSI